MHLKCPELKNGSVAPWRWTGLLFDVNRERFTVSLGRNGAGKSTMIKIISGVYRPDAGKIKIMGDEVVLKTPWEGVEHGVVVVHQELSLVPDLTVAENLLMPRPPVNKAGLISNNEIEAEAAAFFEKIGIHDLFPGDYVSSLTLRSKQILEIAKALYRRPVILILDEPTSALSIRDVQWLSEIIRGLRDQDHAIVYISHRLGEIKDLCDRLTILRNGKEVGTYRTHEIDDDEVIRLMVGRSLAASFPPKPEYGRITESAVEIQDLTSESGLSGISLSLHKGEVLGVAGLQGQGQRSLFRCLFGLEHPTGGRIVVDGRTIRIRTPRDAIHAGLGFNMGLVPEERKTEGLILDLSIRQNLTLPVIDEITEMGWINNEEERKKVEEVAGKINIDLEVIETEANSLSGGNQQKVVIAKWLLARCKNMLMFDPTRGVDVATKFEIYNLIRKMADDGNSVLIYSSELPELVNLCDRVLALYDGKVMEEFEGLDITEEKILAAILGMNLLENGNSERPIEMPDSERQAGPK